MRLLGLFALMALTAQALFAQYPMIPRIYGAASLPTGTPYWRAGTAFLVTDGANDSDCATGGGSSVHWCFSDGAGAWSVETGAIDGAGSANQVAYWSDGNTLISASSAVIEAGAGANTLVVDSNSRVGIGTAGPLMPLHVYQNTAATDLFVQIENDATDRRAILQLDNDAESAQVRLNTNDDFQIVLEALVPFTIQDGAGTNTVFIDATSNIGIATSGPNSKLHVIGGICVETSDSGCTAAAGETISDILELTPKATAPASCTQGQMYMDTSGAMCVCTSANTWTNTTGIGTCA